MSSLRISHQNRGIGALGAGSDTGRSEHAEEGGSFAVALGAAAGAVPKDAVALLGGKPGDGGALSPGPRKRAETPAKPNDPAAIAANAAGALISAPVIVEPATNGDSNEVSANTGTAMAIAGSGGTATACGPATSTDPPAAPRFVPGASNGAIQTITSKMAVVANQVVPAAPTGAVTAAPVAAASAPASPDLTMTGTAHADGLSSAPALSDAGTSTSPKLPGQGEAPAIGADAVAPATGAGADAPPTSPGVVVTPDVPVSHIVSPVQALAAPALPMGAATTGTPNAATVGVAADASGVAAPPAVAPPVGSGPGTPHTANAAATAPPALRSLTAGQPVTADGGGAAGFVPRDRLMPVASTPEAGSIAAAASAHIAVGNASAPTVSSAASAPGPMPDAAGANTIADQVAGQLARMVSNGSGEMVMRLHPPELGDLTVRVAVNGRDVAAWFASPQPQVQSAISTAIGQLQTNLGNAGYNLNGAWVGADASSARQQQNSSSPASRAPRAPPAVMTALPAATAAVRAPSSGLNVYV